MGVERRTSQLSFYLSSKFEIREFCYTYVLYLWVYVCAQCNRRFVFFGSSYRHCIALFGGCREVYLATIVFYLSSKFEIREFCYTYVLLLVFVSCAQCNRRFGFFGSSYRHCIEWFWVSRGVLHNYRSICRLNLKFESSAIHTYFVISLGSVRNAIDDSGFLGQVTGIELSNLGHCFRPRYPPGGVPSPYRGGALKEEKRQRKRKRDKRKRKRDKRKRKRDKKRERARGKR